MKKRAAGAADAVRRAADGRRTGAIEDVIAWAWREELPKAPVKASGPRDFTPAWDKTGRFGELLSLVDLHGVNQWGAVPDFSADSWPHADAVAIGDAVVALDAYALELPEDWRPAPELDAFGGLGAKAVADAFRRMTRDDGKGNLTLRLKPSELVVRFAVLGVDVEAMRLDDVEQAFVSHPNGKARWFVASTVDTIVGVNADGSDRTAPETVELNGWDERRRTPKPGAYRKPLLDPDPVAAIIARAEYEIWLSALESVREAVAGRLSDTTALPARAATTPWLATVTQPRILPDHLAEARNEAERKARIDVAVRSRFRRWLRRVEINGNPTCA